MTSPPAIRFADLTGGDLSLLHDWLNRPHLRRFFQKTPISLAEVREKYDPRLSGDASSHCHLAHLDGPFGYLQCYRIADFPDWTATIGRDSGIGVDLFIAEPTLIGRGLGRDMLAAYLAQVAFPLFPGEQTAWIAHEIANTAARVCSEAVGFHHCHDFLEHGLPTALYGLNREDLA